jgi:hypothetical protein
MGETTMSRPGTGDVRAWLLALLAALAPALPALAEAPKIEATLEPAEISLGETAELAVTVTGQGEAPRVPRVDGLEIESAGQSAQIQIVNGQVSRTTSFLYQVRPLRTGSFTLPALEVAGGHGGQRATLPLALQVVSPSGSSRALAPAGAPRLELVGPAESLFVGQLEPVALRMLVPDGVQLAQVVPPTLTGAGFTISALADGHPEESRAEIDGVPMTVLTWTAAVSAVKPGPQTLDARIEGLVVAKAPARPRGARRSLSDDDLFGGSLLDRFFGGLRQQPLHLASPPLRLDVQALPEAGAPADFDGAVGEFQLSAEASPTRTTAGDPVTLRLRVEGRGNFDRVRFAGMGSGAGFKAYPPTARFEGEDATGAVGRKLFEQTIIPERVESATIPPQHFSYFDPRARAYVTLSSDAVPIAVAGAGPGSAPRTAPAGQAAAPSTPPAPTGEGSANPSGILPLRADLGALRRDTTPLFQRPAYGVALALPLSTLVGVGLVVWRRRRLLDPRRARVVAADCVVAESLRAMDEALARGDAQGFHAAARRALQARLALRLDANPSAVTAADAETGLAGEPRLAASVRRLLEEADAVAYAGLPPRPASLAEARGLVLATLKQLEVHA